MINKIAIESSRSRLLWLTCLQFASTGSLYGIQIYLLQGWFQDRGPGIKRQWA